MQLTTRSSEKPVIRVLSLDNIIAYQIAHKIAYQIAYYIAKVWVQCILKICRHVNFTFQKCYYYFQYRYQLILG